MWLGLIKKNNKTDPVITVKTSKSNTYASEVEILGKSKLIYSPNKPLACGARVWIETDEKIVLDNGITIEWLVENYLDRY